MKGDVLHKAFGAQPFNYTDAVDALPNSISAFAAIDTVDTDNGFINADGLFQDAGADLTSAAAGTFADIHESWDYYSANVNGGDQGADLGSNVSDAGAFVLAETALNDALLGQNPVVTCKLQLNGRDRFSEREGTYFDLVQPFQHHTRSPDTGINVYSFALRPEEHQPSEHATSPESITLPFSLSSPPTLSEMITPLRSVSTPLTQCPSHYEWYGRSRILQLSLILISFIIIYNI